MPAKKNPQYLSLIKKGLYGTEPYKRSGGKDLQGVTYSFSMQKDKDDDKLLAKFATSEREVARLHSDSISINLVGLPTQILNDLISTIEGYVDESGETLTLPIAENENAIRLRTQENMFEMEIVGEGGVTYKCIIDPLGMIISTKEEGEAEKQIVNTRPNIEEVISLSETAEGRAAVQKQIVNCGLTPEFLEAALNPDDLRVRTPQKITELSPALVEMYLKHKISTGEVKEQDGAYIFKPSEKSKYTFMAIKAPLEKGESEPKLIFFAQKGGNADKSGTTYICRDRFYEIKDLRFTTTGSKKSTTRAHITFTTLKSRSKTTSTSIAVPLEEGFKPNEQIIKHVLDFVGKTAKVTAASTDTLSDWLHESASIRDLKGGVPPLAFVARGDLPNFVHVAPVFEEEATPEPEVVPEPEEHDFADRYAGFSNTEGAGSTFVYSPSGDADIQRFVSQTEEHEPVPEPVPPTGDEQPPIHDEQPDGDTQRQDEGVPPVGGSRQPAGDGQRRSAPAREQHLANGGPRVNPYLEQPRKVIKKVPKKLNEDLIRYGGFAIGLLMLPLLLLGPIIGPILFTAGLVIAAGSIGLANYIHAFNDNPYNNLITKYQNQLSREQNEAEEQAGKFWEVETELGTERDNFANLRDLILSPEFVSYDPTLASNINGALFEHLFHTTNKAGKKAFEEFWNQSLEYRMAFLEDLRAVMPKTYGIEELDREVVAEQKHFLRKYGIDDALLPIIFERDYEVSVPDPSDPSRSIIKTISAQEALERGIAVLERYNDCETRIRALHDQVGQTIQDCSGIALERIISQPGVDIDKFVTEHAHDLAARFLYRKDIPQAQIDLFLSKLSPESAEKIMKAKDEVQAARAETKAIAHRQKANDAQYERALESLDRLDLIREDGHFDESSLKTVSQISADVETVLWSLSGEDAKRNAMARASTKEPTTDGLQALCLSGFDSPLGPTTAADLVHFGGYSTYTQLLHERNELLSDPRIIDALTNQVMLVGNNSPLVSGVGMLSLDEDSLRATLDLLKEDSLIKKDPELLERVIKASRLEETRRDAKQIITEGTAEQLQKRMKWDRYAGSPSPDIDAEIGRLEENYPHFATLSKDCQRKIATMILGRDEVLQATIEDKHATETDAQKKSLIKAAEKDFDSIIEGLVSGTFAEKCVADKELQTWEDDKPDDIPAREESRDRLLEMDYTLTVYGIEGADRKAVIEKMSQLAQSAGRATATREDLLNAIFEQTKSSQLNDCSESGVEHKTTLGKVAKGKNMAKKEDVQALREKLETMREQSEKRAKEKTNPLKQVAGKRQVEHDYDVARKDRKEKGPAKAKVGRREKRYNKAIDKSEEFLSKANKALDRLGKVSTCVTGKVGSKTKAEMKSRVDDLQTALSKESDGFLSNGEMKDLFADLKGVGSWDDIKRKIDSGKFTEAEFKLIKAQLEKLLREKNRKLAKRLKRRRVKATKQKAEGKNKAADSKTIEQNSEKLDRASDAVTARREKAKARTAAPERVAPELAKEVAHSEVSYKFEKE